MARRAPQNDQRRPGKFVAIPHDVMVSAAWRAMSCRARAILLEIVLAHNGYNNGEIGRSQRQLGEAIGTTSFRDVGAAVLELIHHGLIVVGVPEGRWQRTSRQYRLTWLPTGEPPHRKPATDEWRAFFRPDEVSALDPSSADEV